MIAKSHRWQYTAVAAAALLGLWGPNAMALSLGRVTVHSALGEPLRAEVDVPDINAEEAASLKASVASPEAFKAAGLEYDPAMSNLQVTLQKRPDGRTYIRLSSERSISDPFVDLILEVSWASGRIVRDYTLLFDPPNLRQAAPAEPSPSQVASPAPVIRPAAPEPVPTPAPAPAPIATRAVEPRKTVTKVPDRPPVVPAPAKEASEFTIKRGDTAGKIAAQTRPANVSLDQMLVALLRANPAAFIGGNVNRVKAGAVVNIPTAEQAAATPETEATQIIVAQSKDFNDFRRGLALGAPSAPLVAAGPKASGTVQAQVEDKRVVSATPDKLTLSKGAIDKQLAEDQLAKQRSAKESANRAAELAKNINDLSKLSTASIASAPAGVAPPASAALAASASQASPATAVASTPGALAAPIATRPATAPVAPEVGVIDGLIENPLVPAGAIGLVALLATLGFYRAHQRRKAFQGEAGLLQEHLRPDSFFGSNGGQNVDTHNSVAPGSSVVYSHSQLGPADEVDPVAEADVYLAYGRDQQAEDILKDALRSNPGRVAIHQKMLELYAKRRDVKSFESIAALAFKATKGNGPEWEQICELGKTIDADSTLLTGGESNRPNAAASRPTPLDDASHPMQRSTGAASMAPGAAVVGPVDLDLDLDFSLDEKPSGAPAPAETSASTADTTPAVLDLDISMPAPLAEASGPAQGAAVAETNAIEFTLPQSSADAKTVKPAAPPTSNFGMLDFDLGSLSLDLEEPAKPESATLAIAQEDPLATKLALAEEFKAIGDADGARSLIEEVIAEASGDIKIKAQRALSSL